MDQLRSLLFYFNDFPSLRIYTRVVGFFFLLFTSTYTADECLHFAIWCFLMGLDEEETWFINMNHERNAKPTVSQFVSVCVFAGTLRLQPRQWKCFEYLAATLNKSASSEINIIWSVVCLVRHLKWIYTKWTKTVFQPRIKERKIVAPLNFVSFTRSLVGEHETSYELLIIILAI